MHMCNTTQLIANVLLMNLLIAVFNRIYDEVMSRAWLPAVMCVCAADTFL